MLSCIGRGIPIQSHPKVAGYKVRGRRLLARLVVWMHGTGIGKPGGLKKSPGLKDLPPRIYQRMHDGEVRTGRSRTLAGPHCMSEASQRFQIRTKSVAYSRAHQIHDAPNFWEAVPGPIPDSTGPP
jgi:hypothetical protein